MANDKMTIRFAPDGFSFAECPSTASVLLDDAPFHEVAPGADYQQRLHQQLLDALPVGNVIPDLVCQIVSTRVCLLPPEAAAAGLAMAMYSATFEPAESPEQVLLQPLTLPTGQDVLLCFGIDRDLYLFLQRNYAEVTFEHHIATLLVDAARMASGNCMVVRCKDRQLELALFRQQKLDMVNAYQTSNLDTRSYYVLNAWQQQDLDQLRDNLLVIGEWSEALQMRASLHRFIKHVFS